MVDFSGSFDSPTKGPSIAFAILFTISGVIHVAQISKHKIWVYMWLLPFICIIFTAGFICREYNAYHPGPSGGFPASQGLFYSAASLTTPSLGILLARLLVTKPRLSPLRANHVYMFFGSFTMTVIIALTAQGTSSFFSPNSSDGSIHSGLILLKTSLILQLFLDISFMGILLLFYRRCSAADVVYVSGDTKLRTAAATLFMLVMLVLIRNVFRTVQIFVPLNSPAWTLEALFWVFDASLMLIFTVMLNFLHLGKLFPVEGEIGEC